MINHAIIPARGGSKGILKKNIKYLGGIPLIAYSIAIAKLSKKINRIIVSTDDPEIAEIAIKFGAEVPFLRPKEISQDSSTDLEFMLHILNWLNINNEIIPKYFIHLRPTTPIRSEEIIDKAIESIMNNNEATSLRSAHLCPESPFKWFSKDPSNTYYQPLFLSGEKDILNMPRQIVPSAYIPNGYVDILISDYILKNNSLHGDKILAFESPFCVEIDTLDDFKYLEYQILNENFTFVNRISWS